MSPLLDQMVTWRRSRQDGGDGWFLGGSQGVNKIRVAVFSKRTRVRVETRAITAVVFACGACD